MNKKLKLSPWHDGSVKPVHVGVYEGFDDILEESFFSYWDGKTFNEWWCSIERALDNRNFGKNSYPNTKWRGVLK